MLLKTRDPKKITRGNGTKVGKGSEDTKIRVNIREFFINGLLRYFCNVDKSHRKEFET